MSRSMLAEPLNVRAVLQDAMQDEARMYQEWHAAVGVAQTRNNAPAPLVDEHDVPFTQGAAVVTYRHISRSIDKTIAHLLPGTKGVIADLGPTNSALIFEGDNDAPYWIATRDMKRVLHVVTEEK